MVDLLTSMFAALASTFRTRASLQVEILALRHHMVSYLDYYHGSGQSLIPLAAPARPIAAADFLP